MILKFKHHFADYIGRADLPLMAMGGLALGFLFGSGTVLIDASTFLEPQNCNLTKLLKGLIGVAISFFIVGIMALYWRFVLKKRGVVYPGFQLFGLLIAFLTVYAGVFLCIEFNRAFS